MIGLPLQIGAEGFSCLFVLALIHQRLGIAQINCAVLILQLNGIVVRTHGLRVVQYAHAFALTETDMRLQFALFLAVQSTVALLVYLRRVVILADFELLVGFLYTLLYAAT